MQGLHIMIREGTAAKNLRDLLPLVTCENSHRCFFVTDDRHPSDLIEEGHMDHAIRTAIGRGPLPVIAIQMATLNPARYFMLNNHGAIAPGYFADLVAFESLEQIKVRKVFKNGELRRRRRQAASGICPSARAWRCAARSTSSGWRGRSSRSRPGAARSG